MAWYLNEVLTDLSIVEPVLRFYWNIRNSERSYEEKQEFLQSLYLNLDYIDNNDIPDEYGEDPYRWLIYDLEQLFIKLNLLQKTPELNALVPTKVGQGIMSHDYKVPDVIKDGLIAWQNDQGIHPYAVLKELLTVLNIKPTPPCKGLLLLEVLLVLLEMNRKRKGALSVRTLYRFIQKKRELFFKSLVDKDGDEWLDVILYSDFLWEELSQDLYYYQMANYPARSTLINMMSVGEIVFENVPAQAFGLVQTVTVS